MSIWIIIMGYRLDSPPWSHQGNKVNTDSCVGSTQSGAVLVSQGVDILIWVPTTCIFLNTNSSINFISFRNSLTKNFIF